jgi:hypothetical protein
MRANLLILTAAAGCLASASATAGDCVGSGSMAKWGNSMTAQFPIAAGDACSYGFVFDGEMYESRIARPPSHGVATMINRSTVEYRPQQGYKGQDSFTVEARGKGPSSAGVSVITLKAIVK